MSLDPTTGPAMVLLTSGIVDEAPCHAAGRPPVLPTPLTKEKHRRREEQKPNHTPTHHPKTPGRT